MVEIGDRIRYRAFWRIEKYRGNFRTLEEIEAVKAKPYSIEEWEGNICLNEGLQEEIDIICGLGSPTKWDSENARLGVGDSDATPEATQTGLQATMNKTFRGMATGYPTRSGQTAEWRAVFEDGAAQYAWKEYTVVNAADDSGKNLNRCIASKGTKTAGESWTLSLKITFS